MYNNNSTTVAVCVYGKKNQKSRAKSITIATRAQKYKNTPNTDSDSKPTACVWMDGAVVSPIHDNYAPQHHAYIYKKCVSGLVNSLGISFFYF